MPLVVKLLRDLRWSLLAVVVLLAGFQCLWVKITQRTVVQIAPFFATLANLRATLAMARPFPDHQLCAARAYLTAMSLASPLASAASCRELSRLTERTRPSPAST